jgi:alpha-1,2-mannosyltransferase
MLNILKALFLIPVLVIQVLYKKLVTQQKKKNAKPVVAFFHPYCNDGGGGERVLWNLVRVAQEELGDRVQYRLYHGDKVEAEEILKKTSKSFGIELKRKMEFVRLQRRRWVEAALYPSFTMLGQALGAVVLGLDALLQADAPEYMFDSMGFAFAYPVFSMMGGCQVLSYTHYPVISTDMLERVLARRPSHNNSSAIAKSATLSFAKSSYYKLFAKMYGWVGRWSALTMVNSKWTQNHINAIWNCPEKTHVVYPAVDTSSMKDFPLAGREPLVISIAQFRPEKDHALQLCAYARFRKMWKGKGEIPRLVMIGSVRNDGDLAIVKALREYGKQLELVEDQDYVLALNVSYTTLLDYFKRAKVGLHSMWNEHFGIGVVELLAGGVLTIAHNSGGPKSDILSADENGMQIGFGATTVDEYADAMVKAFGITDTAMQARARQAMKKFSEEAFADTVQKLLPLVIKV